MSTHLGTSLSPSSQHRNDSANLSARVSHGLKKSGDYVRDNSNQLRIPEFVIFGAMVFATVLPVINQPLSQIAVVIGALYGLTKPAQYELGRFKSLKTIMWLGLVYMMFVSLLHTASADAFDWRQRLVRMIFTTILMWNLAEGRLHFRSAIAGYLTALLINVPAFYRGITERSDGNVLVGFLHDKNYAGLAYAIFGVLAFAIMRTMPERIFAFVLGTSVVWLTNSRTSITAYLVGVLWVLLASRFNFMVRMFLLGGVWALVQTLATDYAQVGQFASRVGSDMLRERIDAVAQEKAETAGFFGSGLGEAYAPLQDRNWVYHNSYLVLRTEGGWVWTVFVIAITIIVGMRIFVSKTSWTVEERVGQGAAIALLVCGLSLGEVFYTFTWAIVIAYAVRAGAIARNRELGMPGYEAENFVGVDRRIEMPKSPEKITAYIANRIKNS